MRRATVVITALVGALIAAPAAFADARGGALYTGKAGRATVRLGVADGGRSIPDYAFSFRRGRCNDGTSWSSALDQRLEPDIDVTAAGRFDVTLSDRFRYTHGGKTRRVRIVSDATGHFSRSGRIVRGTFRQTLKAVHGSFACRSGRVRFTARVHGRHPGLTLELENATPEIGQRISVRGRFVTGDRGAGTVAIFGRALHGRAEEQLGSATLTRAGRFATTVRPDHDVRLRAEVVEDGGGRAAESDPEPVFVYTRSGLGLRRKGGRLIARWAITGHHVDRDRGPKVYFYFRRTGERRFHRLGARTLHRTAREGFTSTLTAALSFRSRRGGTASICVRTRPYPDMHGFVPKKGCGRESLRF
jgi:hypothetical protein